MSTQLRGFETNLKKIIEDDAVNRILRDCASNAGNALTNSTVCVTISDGDVYQGSNANGTLISDLPADFAGNLAYKPIDIGDGLTQYTYGNIYTKLVKDAAGFNGNVAVFAQDLTDISAAINVHSGFKTDHPDNINKYKTMKNKRKELDWKMRELYDESNSDVNLLFDNSVYVNLAWTVLATSVLYYLFVKL